MFISILIGHLLFASHTPEGSPSVHTTSLEGNITPLFQENEPQTTQFGEAGLATSLMGGQ